MKTNIGALGTWINQQQAHLIYTILSEGFGCYGIYVYENPKEITEELEGVYLLCRHLVVEYVGTAVNIKTRKYGHKHYDGQTMVFIDTHHREIRKRLETTLIAILNPAKNKKKVVYGK